LPVEFGVFFSTAAGKGIKERKAVLNFFEQILNKDYEVLDFSTYHMSM
jgi:hypothetical protein